MVLNPDRQILQTLIWLILQVTDVNCVSEMYVFWDLTYQRIRGMCQTHQHFGSILMFHFILLLIIQDFVQ